jgi:glycosyltransferase involved in cell wall biosynthesis
LRDWLHGEGVPEAKLGLLPPAPTLGVELADARQARRTAALRPLLLADAAAPESVKDSLFQLVLATRRAGMPLAWRAIGDGAWCRRLAPLGVALPASLEAALADSDLVLLPDAAEATPLLVLDAQRLGCVPVLPQDAPAAWMLRDGVDGLLVRDARAAQALLASLAGDRARLAALSAGAAASGAEAPDWHAATAEFRARLATWFPTATLAP